MRSSLDADDYVRLGLIGIAIAALVMAFAPVGDKARAAVLAWFILP